METALEQGRDVFAVPGQINNPLSAGPHRFLQEGARLITGVDDILEEYGQKSLFRAEEVPESKMALTKEEERVLQYITAEPVTIEEIAYACGFHQVSHFINQFKKHEGCTPLRFRNAWCSNEPSKPFSAL